MMIEAVPESARALVRSCLDTYEKLHIVRALFLAGHELGLAELAQRCELSSATTREELQPLLEAGVVVAVCDARSFAYVAGDAERDAGVAALCGLLAQDAVVIAALLNAAALERARDALEARMRFVFGVGSSEPSDDETGSGS